MLDFEDYYTERYPNYKPTGLWITHKQVAKNSWNDKGKAIQKVVSRLEKYPADISCYLTQEESVAATQLKNEFIGILREELLNE